jgi:hypothetical protein
MVVSRQLHAPNALPSWKTPLLNIKCLMECDVFQFSGYMTFVMNMETVGLSEMLVPVHQITRHLLPEDRTVRVAT